MYFDRNIIDMKSILFILASLLLLIACKKDDCEPVEDPRCEDVAPQNEACQAYFVRYFYQFGGCRQIGYSGCSQRGFESRQECEACDCNN